jgi:hypothetical protein
MSANGNEPEPLGLFEKEDFDSWREHWVGMPEYENSNLEPWKSIIVHFACRADMDAFAALVGQNVPGPGPGGSIWYPKAEIGRFADKRYADR